jgi:hypothetical protein
VPLRGWPRLIFFQNGVDHAQPRAQLGPFDRTRPANTMVDGTG